MGAFRTQNEKSVIENGEYVGKTLEKFIQENDNSTVSPSYDGARFPLLIKLIDACDSLSVQVRPDDSYAARYENDIGKTEMWYILSADEGASLIYGLCDGVDEGEFASAVDLHCFSLHFKRIIAL